MPGLVARGLDRNKKRRGWDQNRIPSAPSPVVPAHSVSCEYEIDSIGNRCSTHVIDDVKIQRAGSWAHMNHYVFCNFPGVDRDLGCCFGARAKEGKETVW